MLLLTSPAAPGVAGWSGVFVPACPRAAGTSPFAGGGMKCLILGPDSGGVERTEPSDDSSLCVDSALYLLC